MANLVGQQFGNYRLLRRLGSGGFAEVYEAEHIYLGTHAAIKVTNNQLQGQNIQKFYEEARKIARLIHPQIVRLLEFGVEGNTPFMVMDYAPHGTLRDRHSFGSILPLSSIVSYVNQIADALQYAHDQKIIHRDVKPENMLVDANNNILVSDFGIAVTAHRTDSQRTQDKFGTIYYMAPEHIQGKPRVASDQYSLGIVVYEWLSGTYPFDGLSDIEIAMKHLSEPPPSFGKLLNIPPQVEQVVQKALAKDPKQRFPNVQEFARALEQAVQKQPAIPLAPSLIQPVSAPLGTTIEIYQGHWPVISVTWSPNGRYIVTRSMGGIIVTQIWEVGTGKVIADLTNKYINPIDTFLWSFDGKYIATISKSKNGKILEVRDATFDKSIFKFEQYPLSAAWSPNGQYIAVVTHETVSILETATGRCKLRYEEKNYNGDLLTWSPDGKYISSGLTTRWTVREVDTGNVKFKYTAHMASYWIIWSPDGKYFASTDFHHSTMEYPAHVYVWETDTGKMIVDYQGHSDRVLSIAWSPNGMYIVSGGSDHTAQVWEVKTGIPITNYIDHTNEVYCVVWSSDGKYIASGSADNTVQVWEVNSGRLITKYTRHSDLVSDVVWSPDGQLIASGSHDKTVHVWVAPK